MFIRKCKITFIAHGATVHSVEGILSDSEKYPKLNDLGEEYIDFGTHTTDSCHYPIFAARAAKLLDDEGAKPDDGGMIAKMGAKWGIMMNVMKDSTTEHMIQMMIEGTTMGVGELLRWIREAENKGVSEAALKLAREVCTYQEKTVDDLKEMLKK